MFSPCYLNLIIPQFQIDAIEIFNSIKPIQNIANVGQKVELFFIKILFKAW